MKHFRCGDVVPGCTKSFAGTEEEILARVSEHARHDHGLTEIPGELLSQVRSAIRAA